MEGNNMNDMLLSLDAAWLCSAERDLECEEDERRQVLATKKRRGVKGKYEIDTAAQLDKDIKQQQLELQRRAVRRAQSQQPVPSLSAVSPQHEQRVAQKEYTSRASASVYERENERLAALLSDPSRKFKFKRKKPHPRLIGSIPKRHPNPRIVDDMLILEKNYATSAARIQRWWRNHLRVEFWKMYVIKVRATVCIQRMVRGFVCRAFVRVWHQNRTRRATTIQALFRGYYVRCVLESWRLWEYVNATKIQATMRGYMDRNMAKYHRKRIAVVHIQCLWRGYRSRKCTDLLWLSQRATELQRLTRGVLTRKRTRRKKTRVDRAVTEVQRLFRGMLARVVIGTLLCDRETQNRHDVMRMLEAEEEWYRVQRDRLQARLTRMKLFEQLCDLESQYFKAHGRVSDMETIYLDMQNQRLRVSPRAVEQGWVEEMEHKMKLQRQLITQTKLDVIFSVGLRFRQKEEEYLMLVGKIRDIEDKRQRLQIWREEEFFDYWQRECLHWHQQRQIERKRRIAEERRKWSVQFYLGSGKRDKRWKGTHWSDDVLEDAKQREVFCLGNTNLLAAIQAKWRKHLEFFGTPPRDTQSSLTEGQLCGLDDEIALATSSAQFVQTQAIFDPIFRDIEERATIVKAQFDEQKKRRFIADQRRKLQERIARQAREEVGNERSQTLKNLRDFVYSPDGLGMKYQHRQSGHVPWHLIDRLAAERRKLDEEKAMFKIWGRVPKAMMPKAFQASYGGVTTYLVNNAKNL